MNKAFQDEAKRRDQKQELWTLPASQRTYYSVSLDLDDNPYLLIGIGSSLNISSLGKIATVGKRMGTCCFKYFFANVLLPELRKRYPERDRVSAIASTVKGKCFFERLKCDLPEDVKDIRIDKTLGDAYQVQILIE